MMTRSCNRIGDIDGKRTKLSDESENLILCGLGTNVYIR